MKILILLNEIYISSPDSLTIFLNYILYIYILVCGGKIGVAVREQLAE